MSILFVLENYYTWLLVKKAILFVKQFPLFTLYLDGVAPRAKMNQQRSRRFRAAQLAQIEQEANERVSQELAGNNDR